jgi:hypothetical protein
MSDFTHARLAQSKTCSSNRMCSYPGLNPNPCHLINEICPTSTDTKQKLSQDLKFITISHMSIKTICFASFSTEATCNKRANIHYPLHIGPSVTICYLGIQAGHGIRARGRAGLTHTALLKMPCSRNDIREQIPRGMQVSEI